MAWIFDYETARNSPIFRAEATARRAVGSQPAPQKPPINLTRGWPAPELHPTKQLLAAADTVFLDRNIITPGLQYGPDPGYQPLRESISTWLSQYYSAEDNPERICITGGASQNLANVLAGFTDPNITKRIWMATPTYYLASRIFEDAGFAGRLRAVHEDEGGLDVKYLAQELEKLQDEEPRGPPTKTALPWRKTYSHIIYCVPTFSNPSTRTMKESRRRQLVHLAAQHNALIITDDVYDFLHWPMKTTLSASNIDVSAMRALLPRITDVERNTRPAPADPDGFGYSMSNGSFSKILGPGVRTGWADCNPKLAYGLSQVGATKSGGAPSQITATFIDQMIRQRTLQTHIAKTLLPNYQQRWKMMTLAIVQSLAPLGVKVVGGDEKVRQDVFGGYFIWLQLPRPMSSDMVALSCLWEQNLTISQGSLFQVTGDTSLPQDIMLKPCIRLCFAYESIEMLMEGVYRLGEVVTEVSACKGPVMDYEAVINMAEIISSVLGIARQVLEEPEPVTEKEKNERISGLSCLERLLPNIGGEIRRAYICGIADGVRESDARRPLELARELDELVRQARFKVLGPGKEREIERFGDLVHAECCVRKRGDGDMWNASVIGGRTTVTQLK